MATPLPPRYQQVLHSRTAVLPVQRVTVKYGQNSQQFQVSSGSVTMDRRRSQRTTATLTLLVEEHDLPGIITPLGALLDIEMGVRLGDGTEEYVTVATNLSVTGVSGDIRPRPILSVQAADRSEIVVRNRFERPFTVSAPRDLASVCNLVLTNRGMQSSLEAIGVTIQTDRVFGLEAGTDPWAELTKLVEGFGWRLWIGRDGMPVLDQVQPHADAREVSVIVPTMDFSGRPPNVVVARFEPNEGTPRTGIAEDTDPASPTFVGGPYGRVQYFYSSPTEVSQAGANQAAESILAGQRFQGASWAWTVPYDPTIDPDDLLRGSVAESNMDLIVDAVTINLTGATKVEGRQPR